jgi:hypothetical protein
LTRLKPIHRLEARQILENVDAEVEHGSGGEEMANDVVMGDNIVVLCQISTYEFFWIMPIDIPIHMVKEHFIDVWGQ